MSQTGGEACPRLDSLRTVIGSLATIPSEAVMTTPDPTLEALDRVPLFADISHRRRKKLAQAMDLRSFGRGKLLMLQDHRGEQLLVVVEGEAEVTRGGEVVATVGAGSFIGEAGLLDHADRNATVRATTPLKALVLEKDGFEQLHESMPDVLDRIRAEAVRRRPG